jgi:tellurite resistance protein
MDIDDRKAMALAALARVEEQTPDPLLRAIAGAFAVVACADGELSRAELDRFVRFVHDHEAFRGLAVGALTRIFRDLSDAIFADFETGRGGALASLAAVKGTPEAEVVLHAAEVATLADDKLRGVERVTLETIAVALGLDPSTASPRSSKLPRG